MNEEMKEGRLVEIAKGVMAIVYDDGEFRILLDENEDEDVLPRLEPICSVYEGNRKEK